MKFQGGAGPARLLCVLLMTGCLFWSYEVQGASARTDRGFTLAAYQESAACHGYRGHIRRPSTGRKRHPRARKHHWAGRGVRTGRAYAWAAARHGVSSASRRIRHRHGRYFARKGPSQRLVSARSDRGRLQKLRTLSAQGAKSSAAEHLAGGGTGAKRPVEREFPTALTPRPLAGVTGAPSVAVNGDGRISANVQNRPLGEMLRLMSEKHLFSIQGALPTGAPVTMQFSDLTLDQAFTKMMRGYNYAVIKEVASDRRILIVLGEARRVEYKELAMPAQALRQSGATLDRTASQVPDSKTSSLFEPATIKQPRSTANAKNPAAATGSQAVEAPPVPSQDQRGAEQASGGGFGAAHGFKGSSHSAWDGE